MPDLHRIEPELLLPWTAIRHIIKCSASGIPTKVPSAVIPKTNVVEVVDAEDILGYIASHGPSGVEESVGERVLGEVVEKGAIGAGLNVGGIGAKEVERVRHRGGFIGPTGANDDERDEGDDGQGHRGEDASEAAEFAHSCDG